MIKKRALVRKTMFGLLLVVWVSNASAINPKDNQQPTKQLNLSCENFTWGDIESLVQPYLDEAAYTALVMQGQSAEYRVSVAAEQAMDESLPKVIKLMLKSIIEAEC